jgi:hypothetical protein
VIPPGLRGEVSGVFNATAVEDALRAVLDQAGLTAELQGGVVVVREQPFAGFGSGEDPRRAAERAMRDADRATRTTPGAGQATRGCELARSRRERGRHHPLG